MGLLLALPVSASAGLLYSERDLIDGFNLTVFGREVETSPSEFAFVSKFPGAVRFAVVNVDADSDRTASVRKFARQLDRLVAGLRLIPIQNPKKAQLVVYLVKRSGYNALVSTVVNDGANARFMRESSCNAVMWSRMTGVLVRAAVFIVVDEGERRFQSCLAEELTQALGPANDNNKLVHSLYNDTNNVDDFGLFDWYILSALYDPRILSGMTPREANALLPAIFRSLRKRAPVHELPAR